MLGAVCLSLTGCGWGKLQADSYVLADLDGVAEVQVPKTMMRWGAAGPSKLVGEGPALLGDHAADVEESNFWAVSHAFYFGERAKPQAWLLVSRVADVQSFSPGQVYFEWTMRLLGQEAKAPLSWQARALTRTLSRYQSRWQREDTKAWTVWLEVDRERLLEVLLLGDPEALGEGAAEGILAEVRRSYRPKRELGGYFASIKKALDAMAERRRPNYSALLQALENEELDYAPTPKVVLFNRQLACQFRWRSFDRSGVPWEFAILGRLGETHPSAKPEEWAALEGKWAGMKIFSFASGGEGIWLPYRLSQPRGAFLPSRLPAVAIGGGWPGESAQSAAYAGLEFRFDQKIPDLSVWLDDLEKLSEEAEKRGLVEAGGH